MLQSGSGGIGRLGLVPRLAQGGQKNKGHIGLISGVPLTHVMPLWEFYTARLRCARGAGRDRPTFGRMIGRINCAERLQSSECLVQRI